MDNIEEKYFLTRGKVILFSLAIIIIIIIIMIIKNSGSSSLEEYHEFETELASAAENYFIINEIEIDDGREERVSLNSLDQMNLIYNELKNKCSGYVIVSSEKDIYSNLYEIYYRPYIKCPKYITANYSEY